jgi:hypothetical protein
MSSPLVFTYNIPGTLLLSNLFENRLSSPLPGASGVGLINLQSVNINLNGVTLTLQNYGNTVTPLPGATTSLQVYNETIIASYGSDTIGTLTWVQQYPNPVPSTESLVGKTRLTKLSSFINSATGIFSNYQLGNVITQFDNNTGKRIITIYAS